MTVRSAAAPDSVLDTTTRSTANIRFRVDGSAFVFMFGGDLVAWSVDQGFRTRALGRYFVHDTALHPQDPLVAIGDGQGLVTLVHAETGETARRMYAHRGGVARVAFNPSGDRLLTAGNNGEVKLWTLDRARLARELRDTLPTR